MIAMIPKIDVKYAEAVAKSTVYLALSGAVALVATVLVIMLMGWAADHYHTHPWMSLILAVHIPFVTAAGNMLGIHFFRKSEAVL
jgi:F0F1-type ATP synthase assembly protein I